MMSLKSSPNGLIAGTGLALVPSRARPPAGTVRLAVGTGGKTTPVELNASPDDARRRVGDETHNTDQARKMRVTVTFVTACCIAAILGLRVVKGDPVARIVFQSGLAVCAAFGLWAVWFLRDLRNYSKTLAFVLAHNGALAAACAYYYWGVFSGAIIIVPAAALLIAHAEERWRNITLAIAFLGAHATIALLQIFGAIADRGYTPIDPVGDKTIAVQLVRLALIQFIMAGGFFVAAKMRHSSRRSLLELDEALRALAARDALLAEAELARAEVLAINVPGRYSDQTLGNYKLGLVIGRGGLGVVYDAFEISTKQPAAIKVLHPHVLAKPEQFSRFTRELKIASELSSPNVVTVYDTPAENHAFPYMAMERLYGEDLADYLTGGPLETDELSEMLEQVARGLDHAHAHGVVHRDIKPRNLFRLETPSEGARWKILDFGACREVEQGSTLTEFGTVLGTPAYMAPEQARGNRVDARADIYSLAVVAYRALTGRPAYAARELPRLLQDVAYAMPPQPTSLCAAHRDVDLALAIGLAKRPYERFETATEFALVFAAALAGEMSPELRERAALLENKRGWGHS